MALQAELEIPNLSTSDAWIDSSQIKTLQSSLDKDFRSIISDLSAISKAYKTMAKDKSTKGAWQDVAERCTKSCQENADQLANLDDNLQQQLNAAAWDYIESLLKIHNVGEAASNI